MNFAPSQCYAQLEKEPHKILWRHTYQRIYSKTLTYVYTTVQKLKWCFLSYNFDYKHLVLLKEIDGIIHIRFIRILIIQPWNRPVTSGDLTHSPHCSFACSVLLVWFQVCQALCELVSCLYSRHLYTNAAGEITYVRRGKKKRWLLEIPYIAQKITELYSKWSLKNPYSLHSNKTLYSLLKVFNLQLKNL